VRNVANTAVSISAPQPDLVKRKQKGNDRMAFFGRRRGPGGSSGGVDATLINELEGFGRFSFDPQNEPLPGDLEFRAYQSAQSNRSGFLRLIADAATQGGWMAIGAERLVVSVIGGDLLDAEYDELMRHAVVAIQRMGCWPARATGYEHGWAIRQSE
jgi:hypothetical protein